MIQKTIVALMLFVRASDAMTLALDPDPEPQDRYDLLRESTNPKLAELKDPLNALLRMAIEKEDTLLVQLVLNIAADEDSLRQGESALWLAAQKGNNRLLTLLLDPGTGRTSPDSLVFQTLDHEMATLLVADESGESSDSQNNEKHAACTI